MATDIALDKATGDLVAEPNNDFAVVTGGDVIDQRIRIRLKVPHGDWEQNLGLDVGEMGFGSRLNEMSRLPMERAFNEIPLVVKEALAPMEDIRVYDVVCSLNPDAPTKIDFTVYYVILEDGEESEDGQQTFDDFVQFDLGVS